MNVLTRYQFISNFNKENITRQEASNNGVTSIDFKNCDSNGDGSLSIDEILADQTICEKLLQAIQTKIDKVSAEEAGVKAEQAKAEKEPDKAFSLAA